MKTPQRTLDDWQALIDKYWEGQTSLEEEKALKSWFAQGAYPQAWAHEAAYFIGLQQAQTEMASQPFSPPVRPLWNVASRWVAAAAVVAGLWWGSQQWKSPSTEHGFAACDTPEEAYAQTRLALQMVSERLNQGKAGIQYLQTYQNTQNTLFSNQKTNL